MKKLILCFLSGIIALYSCSNVIPELTGAVNGTVSYNETPVEGVEVSITPGGNSFVTKGDGTYYFEQIASGEYTLTFKKKGYKTVSKNVHISPGMNSLVDVALEINGNMVTADMDILNFGKTTKVMSFNIVNQLDRVVSWEIRQDNLPEWVSFKSFSGDVPSNSQNSVSVTVDRSKVKGEKDSFSLDIEMSTGNILSIKVNVEAGKVGRATAELHDVGYDYIIIKFTKQENCAGFYTGVDNTNTRPEADIIQYGVYYTDDSSSIKFYCDQYPGQPHYLYIIPVNEYGQHGEMEVYEIILDSEPQPEPEPEPEPGVVYTKLADIKYPGTYNVKDAVVVYADGRMCIIGDYNDALPLFYTYFDGTYTADLPKQGDVIDITSEVIAFHNVLEFLNPQFTVTGRKNLNDYDYSPAISAFFSYTIEDGSDMTSYCSSSDPGIRLVNLRGKLAKDGQYFDLMVDGTSIIGNLKASDKTIFEEYAGIIVDVQGIAIGYNGVYMDILVTDITQAPMDIPTLESYLGYWDVMAYNVDKGTYEEWTNMYLGTFTDEETGEEIVYFEGWCGYNFLCAYGEYDKNAHQIFLREGWGGPAEIYFGDDQSTLYKSLFYPISIEGDDVNLVEPSRKDYSALVLTSQYNPSTGEYSMGVSRQYLDENGRYANGFTFLFYNIDDEEDYFWYYFYKDLLFSRAANPPTGRSYSRSTATGPRKCQVVNKTLNIEPTR